MIDCSRACNRRLVEVCSQRPVAILFDDMQWCDESSAAALHYLALTPNADRPLFGVLAARDAGVQDNALQPALRGLRHDGLLEELRLGPLAEQAVRLLIARLAPHAGPQRPARGGCAGAIRCSPSSWRGLRRPVTVACHSRSWCANASVISIRKPPRSCAGLPCWRHVSSRQSCIALLAWRASASTRPSRRQSGWVLCIPMSKDWPSPTI